MKRFLSLTIVLILSVGLVLMSGCEKKKLSEMEWDQCRRNLIRCGMEFPEGEEDTDLRELISWMEQNGPYVLTSYELWRGLYSDLADALEQYYGKPMPLIPLEPANSTE